MSDFTDDQLLAYLDGGLTDDESRDVEEAVMRDPALETRLMALDPLASSVSAAFASVPDPARLAEIDKAPRTPVQRRRISVSGVSGLIAAGVFGLGVGYVLFSGPAPQVEIAAAPSWKGQVAAYHSLYVAETLGEGSADQNEIAEQLTIAESVLGLDLPEAVLNDLGELSLRRTQILGFNGATLVQIAFQSAEGAPISLCIIKGDRTAKPSVVMERLAGLSSASWSSESHGFLLIGGEDDAIIAETAEKLRAVF